MKRKVFLLACSATILIAGVIAGCTKDEGKVPQAPPQISSCDTVTYTKHIKPLVDNNCALSGCHAGSTSNPLLETYAQVKERGEAGRIKARAIDANPSIMPPSPSTPLSADQKNLLNCWLTSGMKE